MVGLAVASAVCRLYVRPSRMVLAYCGMLLVPPTGYFLGLRQQRKHQNLFLMKNFKHFSEEFKNALMTGDARYMRDELARINNV